METGTSTRTVLISTVARWALAAVWLYSGWQKARSPLSTQQSLYAYELFPDSLVPLLAVAVPCLELVLGVLLLLGVAVRAAAAVSGVLFVCFIALIASAWARGLTIDCGCFGTGGYDASVTGTDYALEIARDIAFFVLAMVLVRQPRSAWAVLPGDRAHRGSAV